MRPLQTQREIADQVRTILGVLGVYLALFGTAAAVWSVRAAVGQVRYASLLMHPLPADQELSLARLAFRIYPRSYAVCIRAADTAFMAAEKATDKETQEYMWHEVHYWVERGLDLNDRLMELHYLKARLLARQSPVAAVDVWKAYVDWHFWEPRNLEILAKFQEEAGQDQDALQTLGYLKAWSRNDSMRKRIEDRIGAGESGTILPVPPELDRP